MFLSKTCKALLCTTLVMGAGVRWAAAAPLTIDPNQSFLNLSVGFVDDGEDPPVFTSFTTPQIFGSDTTSLSGQLDAYFGEGTIWFLPNGGLVVFDDQDDPMEPGIGGTLPGSAAADYGLIIDLDGAVVGPGAVRDATTNVTGLVVPIVAGTFDSSAITLSLVTGSLDVNLTGFTTIVDTLVIAGNSGANGNANGLVSIAGLDAVVTIPIFVSALVPVEVAPGFVLPLTAIFEGQIVATGQIPEPGSVILLGMGAVGLVAVGVRRKRRKS